MTTAPTDDLRVLEIKELSPPSHVIRAFPVSERAAQTVSSSRAATHRILAGHDDRLLIIVGPCSIHDPVAAMDYASRLVQQRELLGADLEVVMRVYFEKPRTTVGWKGLINDPDLDGSFQINHGLRLARSLLAGINELGLPAGCEFLDSMTPQYFADLVSWGAIGARTTESQVHRELASGLSCPVGFKNGTDGNVKIAIDAILAAGEPHHFLSATKDGRSAIVSTAGNPDCHVILRGGLAPNYDALSVDEACRLLSSSELPERIMIDASHANSEKRHENQIKVCADIGRQVAGGDARVIGAMIESHLLAGSQKLVPGAPRSDLSYGQSITDACIGWAQTVETLSLLAASVRERRAANLSRRR